MLLPDSPITLLLCCSTTRLLDCPSPFGVLYSSIPLLRIFSFTRLLVYSLTHLLVYPFTYLFIYTFTIFRLCSFTLYTIVLLYACIVSLICSFAQLLNYSITQVLEQHVI